MTSRRRRFRRSRDTALRDGFSFLAFSGRRPRSALSPADFFLSCNFRLSFGVQETPAICLFSATTAYSFSSGSVSFVRPSGSAFGFRFSRTASFAHLFGIGTSPADFLMKSLPETNKKLPLASQRCRLLRITAIARPPFTPVNFWLRRKHRNIVSKRLKNLDPTPLLRPLGQTDASFSALPFHTGRLSGRL